MLHGTLGGIRLHECSKCFGIWIDTVTFEQICRNSEQQAAVLGGARAVADGLMGIGPVRYVRCPECRELMHRVNFARCSGVVVDVCRPHGTWFDFNELHRIVEFIRAGGLDRSRERQRADLEAERRRVEASHLETGGRLTPDGSSTIDPDLLTVVVEAAGGLMSWWLKK